MWKIKIMSCKNVENKNISKLLIITKAFTRCLLLVSLEQTLTDSPLQNY